jgi:pyruvate dehydrogenase E2 component (dihydrolipoamide acetyltransferase)
MAKEVLMPKLSSTMETGYVTEWFKKEGDKVSVGEPIFEVMTDKIAIEVEAYDEGVMLKILVQENDVVPVNSVIAYIGQPGEEIVVSQALSSSVNTSEQASEPEKTKVEQAKQKSNQNEIVSVKELRATPAARRLVREKGLDLAQVYSVIQPTSRLLVADVEKFLQSSKLRSSSTAQNNVSDETRFVAWKGVRKLVKEQMIKSVSTIPHVTELAQVDARELLKLKEQLSRSHQTRITLTHLIAYYVSRLLTKHGALNARTSDEGITLYQSINLGIATALDEGLIVPVVHHAHQLNIFDLATQITDVVNKARNNQLSLAALQGGTFTITSLGASKVRHFNPIINHPEVAILGISGLYDEVKLEKGELINVPVFNFSLSFDHRALDGAPVAVFLSELVSICELPTQVITIQ